MTTDTKSTVDYGMPTAYMDRAVHVEVLEQLKVIAARKGGEVLGDDVFAIGSRLRCVYGQRGTLSLRSIEVIREALINVKPQEEDAPLPKGEIEYGLLLVAKNDGRTADAGFWTTDKGQRDARLVDLRDAAEFFEYIAIRKVTEYERG